MTCIGTWSVESSMLSEDSSNISVSLEERGILAVRDQKGFGQCLDYRKKGPVLQISTHGCQKKKSQNVNLSFQGTCQEALVDVHAIAGSSALFENVFYLMLSVMMLILVSN